MTAPLPSRLPLHRPSPSRSRSSRYHLTFERRRQGPGSLRGQAESLRGGPWLVGLVCALLVVVPTSLFAGAQEPEDPRGASRDAPAGAARIQEWTGRSVLHFRGACLEAIEGCVSDVEREDGTFFLPAASGGGSVVVSWRPVHASLRVLTASVAGVEVSGESPLRIVLPGIGAGEHAIRIEPARPMVGAYDQSADWVATLALDPPPARVERSGTSAFTGAAACVLATCAPATRGDSDTFVVPWMARGTLVADWDARDQGTQRVRLAVRGTELAAEGEAPLALDLYALAPGEYSVDVTPLPVARPGSRVEIGWMATLAPE